MRTTERFAGGRIVAEGPPEQVAENKNSYTGQFLRKVLKRLADAKELA